MLKKFRLSIQFLNLWYSKQTMHRYTTRKALTFNVTKTKVAEFENSVDPHEVSQLESRECSNIFLCE